MKRCPECYHVYNDEERFCENDGHELLADPAVAPKPEIVVSASPTGPTWWPAAIVGVVIGIVFGAGVFAAGFMFSTSEGNERQTANPATEVHEKALPNRAVASNPVHAAEPEPSPSPDEEQQAETQPSPAVNTENKPASVRLNQGPISTGEKNSGAAEAKVQTVIEMTDGSTLDVDAAWEDKQGIWYRRSGLVSFVDSSRVKAITTARRETKPAEEPHP